MTRVVNIAQSGGNNVTMRNRIINGAMMIDQRNAGASVTASDTSNAVYVTDRWAYRVLAASKLSFQRSSVAPAGFTNSLLVTSLSSYSVANNEFFSVRQPIEGFNVADLGWGTANAQPITISFWVRSSLTGTFGGGIWNNAENRFYVFSYTISASNTWEQKTITIAGDTSGTWVTGNTTGLMLSLNLGSGGLYTGTTGSWGASVILAPTGQVNLAGTNGATFYITGVQLEAGTTATPFEQRLYGTELALCQRYYYRNSQSGSATGTLGFGVSVATTQADIQITFPVSMRSAPTFAYGGSPIITDSIGYNLAVTSIAAQYNNTQAARVFLNNAATATVRSPATLSHIASNSAYVELTAEL